MAKAKGKSGDEVSPGKTAEMTKTMEGKAKAPTARKATEKKVAAKKAPAKKAAAKKSAPKKAAAAKEPGPRTRKAASRPAVSADERRRLIAEAAYYRALDRGFDGGDPHEDWLAAEREIDLRYEVSYDVERDAAADRPPGIEEV